MIRTTGEQKRANSLSVSYSLSEMIRTLLLAVCILSDV